MGTSEIGVKKWYKGHITRNKNAHPLGRKIDAPPIGSVERETRRPSPGNVIHQGKEIERTRTEPFSNTTMSSVSGFHSVGDWYLNREGESRNKLGE